MNEELTAEYMQLLQKEPPTAEEISARYLARVRKTDGYGFYFWLCCGCNQWWTRHYSKGGCEGLKRDGETFYTNFCGACTGQGRDTTPGGRSEAGPSLTLAQRAVLAGLGPQGETLKSLRAKVQLPVLEIETELARLVHQKIVRKAGLLYVRRHGGTR